MTRPRPRVLAVSSGGGHWVQLMRLRPALADADVTWVTVDEGYRGEVEGDRFHVVPDATRWDRVNLMRLLLRMSWIVLRERPDVVISTGAAVGYAAIRIGGLLRARTLWIDSIANAEELSMSGRKALRTADACLTQWPHLADPGGPEHRGAVL